MISIVIPIFNSEDYLYNCLNSILKQSYQDFEIICFNDASNDASSEILDYFCLKDSRIRVLNNYVRKGELYCKTKSLDFAQGKYVTFLNSYDWISSLTLEILVNHAEENNLDLIIYNNNNLDKKDFQVFDYSDFDKNEIEIVNKEWSKFYLKTILKKTNFVEIINSAKRISLISDFFKNSQKFINEKKLLTNMVTDQYLIQIKNHIAKIESSIKKQHDQTIKFINSQNDMNIHINEFVDIFMENYVESRKSFFNNQENKLKKYFNTDELFRICYFNNFQFLSYSPSENRILLKTEDGIIFGTNNRFYTINEVMRFNGYSIPQLYDFDEFIVFEVGMNRSYASLWFAKFNNCKCVYGFEIDPETYNKALSNINLNPHLSCKIKPYNFGLSNENEEVVLYYVDGCDGVNTMIEEVVTLQPELQDENKLNTKKVQVKKTSDVFSKIIEEDNISSKIVLKLDTEGAEYKIISDLIESDVISKIDVLLGEGHLFEREHYCEKLFELGFRQIELQINPVTYNFAFVKEQYFNVWSLKE